MSNETSKWSDCIGKTFKARGAGKFTCVKVNIRVHPDQVEIVSIVGANSMYNEVPFSRNEVKWCGGFSY